MAPDWFLIDIGLAVDWHQIGATLVDWIDIKLVLDWCRIGAGLALDWHGIDTELTSDWEWIGLLMRIGSS